MPWPQQGQHSCGFPYEAHSVLSLGNKQKTSLWRFFMLQLHLLSKLLEAQSYLGHRQKFWEQYAKLPITECAEWEVTTQTSRNPFICSHPDTRGSCAWEYLSARPVPVGKWHCCRPLLRTDRAIRIIVCSVRKWRRQEGRELFLLSSRFTSLVALSNAKI